MKKAKRKIIVFRPFLETNNNSNYYMFNRFSSTAFNTENFKKDILILIYTGCPTSFRIGYVSNLRFKRNATFKKFDKPNLKICI